MSYAPSATEIQRNRTTNLKRVNQGGSVTRSNGQTLTTGPSAAAASNGEFGSGLVKAAPTGGGVITRGSEVIDVPAGKTGIRRAPAPSVPPPQPALAPALKPVLPITQPAAIQPALNTPGIPVASPTTAAAPQTEGANPLTGDGNAQPGGTTDQINPAQKLGFSQRGDGIPAGQDAVSNSGGSGLYKRTFANPKSASIYDKYVKKIFGDAGS